MTNKRIGLFPASFDPMTLGHLNLIERILRMDIFDELVLAVGVNPEKSALFSLEERVALVGECVRDLPNGHTVTVARLDGLMVEHAKRIGARAIVRGIRSSRDFSYEAEMNFLNLHLAPDIETLYFITDPKYASLSSTLVKQVAQMGGNLDGLVPKPVVRAVQARVRRVKQDAFSD